MSYQLLKFFLPSDEELENVRVSYSKGELLSGEIKKLAIETVQPIVAEHQEQRKLVTDAVLDSFMELRPLDFWLDAWNKITAEHVLSVLLFIFPLRLSKPNMYSARSIHTSADNRIRFRIFETKKKNTIQMCEAGNKRMDYYVRLYWNVYGIFSKCPIFDQITLYWSVCQCRYVVWEAADTTMLYH